MNTYILQAVESKIAEAERSYQAQAGGASFCQLQKDGRVTGGVKYDEGRLVALTAARRMLKDCSPGQVDACRGALAAAYKSWHEALAIQKAKEQPSLPWVAYRQGGADALNWVLEQLK